MALGLTGSVAQAAHAWDPSFMDKLFGKAGMFTNPLFLSLLSTAGAAIAPGTGVETANAANQQYIRAKSMSAMLAKMLGGEMPPGTSMTMKPEGTTIKLPGQTRGATGSDPGFTTPPTPTLSPEAVNAGWKDQGGGLPTDAYRRRVAEALNPFAQDQPGFSGSDLAGLTAEDLSNAFMMRLKQEELGQQGIASMADILYKLGVMPEYYRGMLANQARGIGVDEMNAARALATAMQTSSIPVPGVGGVTLEEWNKLPPDIQSYSYYAFRESKAGNPPMGFNQYKNQIDPTTQERLFKAAKNDPAFMDFLFRFAQASVTPLDVELAKRTAISKLQGQAYFQNPDWTTDVDNRIASDITQRRIFMEANRMTTPDSSGKTELPSFDAAIVQATVNERIRLIEAKIAAGRGKMTKQPELTNNGRTIVWTVKWPDITSGGKIVKKAEEETITYDIW